MAHCGFPDFIYGSYTIGRGGGAVRALVSNVVVSGDAVFSDNSACFGGAILLYQGTLLVTGNTVLTLLITEQEWVEVYVLLQQ